MKHASVSGWSAGQSRHEYPPPWYALTVHDTCAGLPAVQTVPVGSGGSFEPRSPSLALTVSWYAAPAVPGFGGPAGIAPRALFTFLFG